MLISRCSEDFDLTNAILVWRQAQRGVAGGKVGQLNKNKVLFLFNQPTFSRSTYFFNIAVVVVAVAVECSFFLCNNFSKCDPVLIILSLLYS